MATVTTPASRTSRSWRWSAKKYILAALLGTLATLAVVAGISISFAPAHISFSIASAVRTTTNTNDSYYNFTVVARNNKSSHMAARYGALSAQIWYSPTGWVPAEANMSATVCQQPGNANNFSISAKELESNHLNMTNNGGQLNTDMDNSISWPQNCKVKVEAKVWFRSRLVSTRQYSIRASCFPVDFSDSVFKKAIVNCTS